MGLLDLETGGSRTSIRYVSASQCENDATRDDNESTVTGAATNIDFTAPNQCPAH